MIWPRLTAIICQFLSKTCTLSHILKVEPEKHHWLFWPCWSRLSPQHVVTPLHLIQTLHFIFFLSFPVRPILRSSKLAGKQNNVKFDQVTVFSFPRCQGFTSVPSHGGATLGMMQRHSALQRYTLAQHALEQRHRRRERLRERLRAERLQALKHKVSAFKVCVSLHRLSLQPVSYFFCWFQLIISGAIDHAEADRLTVDQIPEEDTDIHIGDTDLEGGAFLQPYSSRQRQALLLAAGVKRIDRDEKRQLHALRLSREACGCDCRGFCEPETCACSLAGIKCQVWHNARF